MSNFIRAHAPEIVLTASLLAIAGGVIGTVVANGNEHDAEKRTNSYASDHNVSDDCRDLIRNDKRDSLEVVTQWRKKCGSVSDEDLSTIANKVSVERHWTNFSTQMGTPVGFGTMFGAGASGIILSRRRSRH